MHHQTISHVQYQTYISHFKTFCHFVPTKHGPVLLYLSVLASAHLTSPQYHYSPPIHIDNQLAAIHHTATAQHCLPNWQTHCSPEPRSAPIQSVHILSQDKLEQAVAYNVCVTCFDVNSDRVPLVVSHHSCHADPIRHALRQIPKVKGRLASRDTACFLCLRYKYTVLTPMWPLI